MSRIIAGSRGGRRLVMPPGRRTRPTTDRVREALFSAVAAWAGRVGTPAEQGLAGLSWCDLYAGSGAVGLEAASRGAAPVRLVESDRRTAELARRNAAELGLQAEVSVARVAPLVAEPAAAAYDVVFADPPYELPTSELDAMVLDLVGHGWSAADGLVVLERSRRTVDPTWPAAFAETWSRRYGETVLHFAAR